MPQSRPVEDITVQTLVWESFAGSATIFQVPAKSLHWVGPIAPYGAPALDTICEVKERVDGECADRQPLRVSLIVDPVQLRQLCTASESAK